MKYGFVTIAVFTIVSIGLTACSPNTKSTTSAKKTAVATAIKTTGHSKILNPSYGFTVHKDPITGKFIDAPLVIPASAASPGQSSSAVTITVKDKTTQPAPEILHADDGSSYIIVPHNR